MKVQLPWPALSLIEVIKLLLTLQAIKKLATSFHGMTEWIIEYLFLLRGHRKNHDLLGKGPQK